MTTANQAEQLLERNGIKFRVVASDRGPGEWNVTFSRKGGGRLKLDYYRPIPPNLTQVIFDLVIELPKRKDYDRSEEAYYYADCKESARVRDFFTCHEIDELLHFQCELT